MSHIEESFLRVSIASLPFPLAGGGIAVRIGKIWGPVTVTELTMVYACLNPRALRAVGSECVTCLSHLF